MILIVELWLSKFNFIRQAENIILRVLYVWLIGTWILRWLQKILSTTYLRMERCVQKYSWRRRVKFTWISMLFYVVVTSVFFVTTLVFLWESLRSNLLALDHNDSHKKYISEVDCRNIVIHRWLNNYSLFVFSCHLLAYNLSWLHHILGVECGNIVVIVD